MREKACEDVEIRIQEKTAELVDSNKALQAEIVERRQAEDALKAERQRFNDILEMLPVYLILLTTDYHVPFANRFFRGRFGESNGRRCFEYLFGRSEPCEICETFLVLKTLEPHHWEWTGPDRRNYDIFDFLFTETDGTNLILEIGIDITEREKAEEMLRMEHDKLEIHVKERTDELAKANEELQSEIIERKRIEEELRESEERYRNLFDNANDAVITIDLQDRITSWNRSAERIFGWKAREVAGRKLDKLTVPSDLKDLWDQITDDAIAGKEVSGIETTRIRKDGSRINVSLTFSPIINAHRDTIGLSCVIRDITERKKIDEIRLENERLISTNKARSEFLTIMSHELRTPLTSIIGYSILLKENKLGKINDEQTFFVNNILSSSKHLLDLINSILDLAKMEAGKLEMMVEEISVPYIINEALKILKERFAIHNIVLKTEFDPELVFIKADRQKFKQILFNLLSNAVKFSKEEGGIITVSVQRYEEMAKISVSDTGIGIKEEDMPRLFQKFEQLDSGISRKYEGTGIGLSITKQLVEMHGGKIFVESKYGEGSTFTVLLPITGESKIT
ncbi:MAG: PAS domain S-box protein [Candidatus Methanoperedens sp.]|nr:PAS domain S-box protein [Candidatus Methanoperedens sp.]